MLCWLVVSNESDSNRAGEVCRTLDVDFETPIVEFPLSHRLSPKSLAILSMAPMNQKSMDREYPETPAPRVDK